MVGYVHIPLIEGHLYKKRLIIRDCPLCGGAHFHGGQGYQIGDVTTRVPHCPGFPCKMIAISVVGELTGKQYVGACNKKPNKKRIQRPDFISIPAGEVGK
jgi:hypothetical protein